MYRCHFGPCIGSTDLHKNIILKDRGQFDPKKNILPKAMGHFDPQKKNRPILFEVHKLLIAFRKMIPACNQLQGADLHFKNIKYITNNPIYQFGGHILYIMQDSQVVKGHHAHSGVKLEHQYSPCPALNFVKELFLCQSINTSSSPRVQVYRF